MEAVYSKVISDLKKSKADIWVSFDQVFEFFNPKSGEDLSLFLRGVESCFDECSKDGEHLDKKGLIAFFEGLKLRSRVYAAAAEIFAEEVA